MQAGWRHFHSLTYPLASLQPDKCPMYQSCCLTNSSTWIFSLSFLGSFSCLIACLCLSTSCNSIHHPRPSSNVTLSTDPVLIPMVRINHSYCSRDIGLCFHLVYSNYQVISYTVVSYVHIYVPLSQVSCFGLAFLSMYISHILTQCLLLILHQILIGCPAPGQALFYTLGIKQKQK